MRSEMVSMESVLNVDTVAGGTDISLGMLQAPIPGASHSHKFFLLRLVHLMAKGEVAYTTSALACLTGVSISTVIAAGKFLVDKRYLGRTKFPTKGRPRYSYSLGPKLEHFRADLTGLHPWQERLILFLLHSTDLDSRQCLTSSERLIISLLILAADDCGVVTSLTTAQIAKSTGLKAVTVKARLSALLQLGFIRRSIPGFKGSMLFGKVPSTHYMNLNHPLYRLQGVKSFLVMNYAYWSSFRGGAGVRHQGERPINRDLGSALVDLAKQKERLTDSRQQKSYFRKSYSALSTQVEMEGDDFFTHVVDYFNEPKKVFIPGILQTRIEGYASCLLSEFWNELNGPPLCSLSLVEIIKSHLRHSLSNAAEWPVSKAPRESVMLLQFLLDVSWSMARRYREMLVTTIQGGSWKGYRFLILPTEAATANPDGRTKSDRRRDRSAQSGAVNDNSVSSRRMSGKFTRLSRVRLSASVMCFPEIEVTLQRSYVQDHFSNSIGKEIGSEWTVSLSELSRNGVISINQADGDGIPTHLELESFPQLGAVRPARK
tara:strand:+ start:14895 stop:16529 length:1635 start_codon:yes stop_codon:yes gene_type:complete